MVAGTLYAAAPSAPAKAVAADIARTALRQPSGVDVDALVQPMMPVQTGSPSLQDQEQLASLLASEQRFVEAVQSREVPAAASVAVEVLKAQIESSAGLHEDDRVSDRWGTGSLEDRVADSPGHRPLALLPPSGLDEAAAERVVAHVGEQMLELEDQVPWKSVRGFWKGRRASWQKEVQAAGGLAKTAECLRDLKSALVGKELELTATWHEQVEACAQGSGSAALMLTLWKQFQAQVQAWLRASNGEQQAPPRQVQRMVKRSLQAMEGCLREGNLPWQAIDQVCSAPAVSAVLGPGVLFS
eukprot:jgi/Astpho2/1178/fgenesh1_pg.00021_%23_23_t